MGMGGKDHSPDTLATTDKSDGGLYPTLGKRHVTEA